MNNTGCFNSNSVLALSLVLIFNPLSVLTGLAATISSEEAVIRMSIWMQGHPIMSPATDREIQSVTRLPADDNAYGVYVVALKPAGYVVLNSDDRLPLIVAFSVWSRVNLDDLPDNAFLVALTLHIAQTPNVLTTLKEPNAATRSLRIMPDYSTQSTEIFGPYLETSWNQCHPYNLFCPTNPSGTAYYGYRAPSGCTPTAYAQVLYYHRWPLFGQGTHTYTDALGNITGQHTADFSTPFGWSSMQTTYDAFTASQPGDTEVADLMYRLGVASDANYETNVTSCSIQMLGQRLNEILYFETPVYRSTQANLLSPLRADLQAGFPAVVAIPGHAIVADGLMTTDGTNDTYHINYGWGGINNGWWSAGNVNGYALSEGCTSLKPALMAFPTNHAVTATEGDPVELDWILPKRREHEASRLVIRQLAQQSNAWSSTASDLSHTITNGWSISTSGHTGNCWYAGPNGYAALTLTDEFDPDASANLTFYMQYLLANSIFSVAVSTNGGLNFTSCFSTNNNTALSGWFPCSIPLGAYAGQHIRIRFELSWGNAYYQSGGVWLDDLSVTSGTWHRWIDFAEDTALASRQFYDQTTLLDDCSDFSVFEPTSEYGAYIQDWTTNKTSGVSNCFYKAVPEFSHLYNLTSRSTITPQANTRLLLRWKRSLYNELFCIKVSSDRSTFTEIWSAGGSADWTEQTISLSAYAGQAIYLRLEYFSPTGHGYLGGGVWIDSISLEDVQYPELEGQPLHYTVLTNVVPGTYTLASVLVDATQKEHELSPSFTLTIPRLFACRTEANGSVILTNYIGSASRLTIPSLLNGTPVTGIASNAFAAATGLVSVTIPASVTNIENSAFTGASNLQRIYFTGNAPSAGNTAFFGTTPTLYYLRGMIGWETTFANRPTALWNPTILGSQTLPTSGFRLMFNGPTNHLFVLEASENLGGNLWTDMRTNVMLGTTSEFTDTTWTNAAARFYRIRTLEPQ